MFSKISVFLLYLLFSLCDQQLKDDRYDNHRPLRVSVSQVSFLFPFVKKISTSNSQVTFNYIYSVASSS